MKTSGNTILAVLSLAAATTILAWPLWAAATDGTQAALHRRKQELKLQLLHEKARVLREDPEAVALRESIEHLYRQLDLLLTRKAGIKKLQDDIEKLDQALAKSRSERR